eukprot:403331778
MVVDVFLTALMIVVTFIKTQQNKHFDSTFEIQSQSELLQQIYQHLIEWLSLITDLIISCACIYLHVYINLCEEKKKGEMELKIQQSEQLINQWWSTLHSLSQGVMLLNLKENQVFYYNDAAQKILGMSQGFTSVSDFYKKFDNKNSQNPIIKSQILQNLQNIDSENQSPTNWIIQNSYDNSPLLESKNGEKGLSQKKFFDNSKNTKLEDQSNTNTATVIFDNELENKLKQQQITNQNNFQCQNENQSGNNLSQQSELTQKQSNKKSSFNRKYQSKMQQNPKQQLHFDSSGNAELQDERHNIFSKFISNISSKLTKILPNSTYSLKSNNYLDLNGKGPSQHKLQKDDLKQFKLKIKDSHSHQNDPSGPSHAAGPSSSSMMSSFALNLRKQTDFKKVIYDMIEVLQRKDPNYNATKNQQNECSPTQNTFSTIQTQGVINDSKSFLGSLGSSFADKILHFRGLGNNKQEGNNEISEHKSPTNKLKSGIQNSNQQNNRVSSAAKKAFFQRQLRNIDTHGSGTPAFVNQNNEGQQKDSGVEQKHHFVPRYKVLSNGKLIELEVKLIKYKDQPETALILITNITNVKKYEKSKQLNKFKTIYFASVAHDLRTPINSVMCINQLLMQKPEHKDIQNFYQISNNSCKFLLNMIDDILDLTRIELQQFTLHNTWFDINTLINEVSEIMVQQMEMKGLEYKIDIADGLPSKIFCDEKRIKQVLFNLVGNALKFTQQGSIKLSLTSERKTSVTRESFSALVQTINNSTQEDIILHFTVEDTGIGIKEEDQSKLFKLFGKLKAHNNINKNGVGLGLTISKKLVEQLGGQIEVKSVVGQGTTFNFNIIAECEKASKLFETQSNQQDQTTRVVMREGSFNNYNQDKTRTTKKAKPQRRLIKHQQLSTQSMDFEEIETMSQLHKIQNLEVNSREGKSSLNGTKVNLNEIFEIQEDLRQNNSNDEQFSQIDQLNEDSDYQYSIDSYEGRRLASQVDSVKFTQNITKLMESK